MNEIELLRALLAADIEHDEAYARYNDTYALGSAAGRAASDRYFTALARRRAALDALRFPSWNENEVPHAS